MTPCTDRRESLLDRALGALPSAELEAHLATCPACSAALAELRGTADQMDRAVVRLAAAEPPASGPAQALARVTTPRRNPWFRWPIAAAATLAAALCVFLVMRQTHHPQGTTPLIITAWRSPTSGLLHSPTDALFKNVPRLGEDYLNMKPTGEKHAH